MPSQEPQQDTQPEDVLEDVDHGQAQGLMRAFDLMAEQLGGVSNSTALWGLAMLLGKIMAAATDVEGGKDLTGKQFGRMLRMAYPMMVQALEAHRRGVEGRLPYDA